MSLIGFTTPIMAKSRPASIRWTLLLSLVILLGCLIVPGREFECALYISNYNALTMIYSYRKAREF